MDEDNDSTQGGDIDLGESPTPTPSAVPPDNDGDNDGGGAIYPTVMLSGDHRLHNIANEGTHKIHARVVSKHMPSRHNPHHRVELELHSIKPQMKRGRPEKTDPTDEDAGAMKKLLRTVKE